MGCPCSRSEDGSAAGDFPRPCEQQLPGQVVQQHMHGPGARHQEGDHQLHPLLKPGPDELTHLRCGSCGQVFGVPGSHAQVRCPFCHHLNACPTKASVQPHAQVPGVYPAPVVDPGGPPPSGRKRALLIGVNYFGTPAELKGCINDVHRSRGLITRTYGFPASPDSLRVLTDDSPGAHARPTRENILAGMRWLVAGAGPGDALFFHFSGHGAQQEDPTYREEDGYDETICPSDFQTAGMIVDDEIFDSIVAPLPSGVKLTAVLDCCHSGTGLDLPFTWGHRGWYEDDNPCHSAGDVLLISGCQEEQTSSDGGGSYFRPMGAMTTALCNTLEHNPVLTYSQLMDSLHSELAAGGFEQVPNLTSSQRFDVGSKMFSLCDGIVGNKNPHLGRHFRKRKYPKRPNLLEGPLAEMLMSSAVGLLLNSMQFGHHVPSGAVMDGPGQDAGNGTFGGNALLDYLGGAGYGEYFEDGGSVDEGSDADVYSDADGFDFD